MLYKRLLAWWVGLFVVFLGLGAAAEETRPAAAKSASEAKQPSTADGDGKKRDEDGPRFIRLRRDDQDRPLAMETAVVSYSGPKYPGVVVDLVGAVHVGDKSYYSELNKLFESYDVLLYELVAPEGTKIPKEGRTEGNAHPIAALQNGMKSILELEHQLECVDYTKKNFVHADMSPAEFAKTMTNRGESFMQMFLRMMGHGMAQQAIAEKKGGDSGSADMAILMALFSRDRARQLKIAMAQQFEDLEGQMAIFDGPDGSTIITERNKKAFEVLKAQLAEGKKKIGVFYGAGHLPDMEKRLADDFGLKRDKEQWIVAWTLEKAKPATKKEK